MIADVDAPSAPTAAEAGATYGYGLIWFFLVLIVPLFLIQEASGRIGIATGKGLDDVIRENYSRRVAVLASFPMLTLLALRCSRNSRMSSLSPSERIPILRVFS